MPSFLTSIVVSFYLALMIPATVLASGTFSKHFAKTELTPTARKMTRLHFYFHDIVSGKNPTAIKIIAPKGSFGMTAMIDDPLTIDTKPGSTVVGRAQGLYALASQHDSALLMVMNFAFTYGKYNGSALSVMGRNPVLDAVREMPVIGGSGVFRFARGYALVNTVRYNPKTGDAVVQYNVTVVHG
ncbi:Plant disease resistance response protein [Artemisia annua]|uniref:Dirigent protein n=1 Tax=Artemisia annua TaxID=35608 RepID=A0A2U1P153_ARTAN|nr:Plant disease resistance response protein [Artemisia annua]